MGHGGVLQLRGWYIVDKQEALSTMKERRGSHSDTPLKTKFKPFPSQMAVNLSPWGDLLGEPGGFGQRYTFYAHLVDIYSHYIIYRGCWCLERGGNIILF